MLCFQFHLNSQFISFIPKHNLKIDILFPYFCLVRIMLINNWYSLIDIDYADQYQASWWYIFTLTLTLILLITTIVLSVDQVNV